MPRKSSSVESIGSIVLIIIAAVFFFDLFSSLISTLMRNGVNQVGNLTTAVPTATVPAGSVALPQSLNASGAVSKAVSQWYTVATQFTPYLISGAFIAFIVALGLIIGVLNAKGTD